MAVRIITDSASDMSGAEHPGLTVLPLSIVFGDTVYQDGVDISHRRFYELLMEGESLPSTGQVNPFAFGQAFERALADGEEVVAITISSKLSGTHQSAVIAAEDVQGEVHVVDSLSAAVGERSLVCHALRLADEGLGAAQIVREIERLRERVVVIALLDTLEYLRRGGRISNTAGAIGEMLSIKPLVTISDGEVVMLGKARGGKNGRKLLVKEVDLAGIDPSMPMEFAYSGIDSDHLQRFIDENREKLSVGIAGDPSVHSLGATIGTHVGPGAIVLGFLRNA
ncbi:MAG: DegV family protein [Collinsella sp.]|nr:DegV family protein [Collinsella sp.]